MRQRAGALTHGALRNSLTGRSVLVSASAGLAVAPCGLPRSDHTFLGVSVEVPEWEQRYRHCTYARSPPVPCAPRRV